ncbi:unnamed protein product [Caenorhabditis brenneri]
MTETWTNYLKDVNDSLGTVYHLLKGEHSDDVDPNIQLLSRKSDDAETETVENHSRSVLGRWRFDGEEFWMRSAQANVPTSSLSMQNDVMMQMDGTSNNENDTQKQIKIYTYSICRRLSSPLSNDSSENVEVANLGNSQFGCSSNSTEDSSWAVQAFLGESNIDSIRFQNHMLQERQNVSFTGFEESHRFRSPEPEFQQQPREHDPALFHLNAFDSPPPSPGNELRDFNFHMQPDPNGMIPDIADMNDPIFGAQDDNNTHNAHVCNLELCRSFHHLLETTPHNVQDKQNIMKEILQHTHSLMREVIDESPLEVKDKMREIRASIFLVNNSLQRSTTMESFEKTSETAKYLLVKIRTAIQEYL